MDHDGNLIRGLLIAIPLGAAMWAALLLIVLAMSNVLGGLAASNIAARECAADYEVCMVEVQP